MFTWEFVVLLRVSWRFHAAMGVDVVYVLGSPLALGLFALVFVTTFVYCFRTFQTGTLIPIPLLASIFGFLTIGAIALALVSSISPQQPPPQFPVLAAVGFFSSFFAVLGFYCGLLVGTWLRLRLSHIHSTLWLLVESSIAGIVVGALGTLVLLGAPSSYEARSDASPHRLLFVAPFLFCAAAGCLISMAFALTFRRRLITTSAA